MAEGTSNVASIRSVRCHCPGRTIRAARDVIHGDAGEVQGDALAGCDLLDILVVDLDAAHPRLAVAGYHRTALVSDADPPPPSVPVTTVPLPTIANERSIHNLGPSRSEGPLCRARYRSIAVRNSSSPLPVRAETATISASASTVPASADGDVVHHRTEAWSTRSDFVTAITPPSDAEHVEDAEVLLALRPPALGRRRR